MQEKQHMGECWLKEREEEEEEPTSVNPWARTDVPWEHFHVELQLAADFLDFTFCPLSRGAWEEIKHKVKKSFKSIKAQD